MSARSGASRDDDCAGSGDLRWLEVGDLYVSGDSADIGCKERAVCGSNSD